MMPSEFQSKVQHGVLSLTKKIPKGKVASYKELASKLKIHPRVVSRALASNPYPIRIPCHRIVHADRKIGGYTPSGQARKIWLLRKEGVKIKNGKIGKEYFYFFK